LNGAPNFPYARLRIGRSSHKNTPAIAGLTESDGLYNFSKYILRERDTQIATADIPMLSKVEQRGQDRRCNLDAMPESKGEMPEFLATSPMSLLCRLAYRCQGAIALRARAGWLLLALQGLTPPR